MFFTVMMLQRNVKVAKSVLERFLIVSTRDSTPMQTPTPTTSSSSSCSKSSSTNNDSYPEDTFEEIEEIDGLELLPFVKQFPFLWDEIYNVKKLYSCVVDCYIDNSIRICGSMNLLK